MSTEQVDDLPLANTGELVAEVGEYSVRQNEKYRWLQDGDGIQSIMDRQTPAKLLLPIHHAMFCAVVCLPQAKRVLNLGCGPGSIERRLESRFKHLGCVSVDMSQQIVDLAKEYFLLAERNQFITMRAEEFLASTTDKFDIVFVDLFERAVMARCLYDSVFYQNLHTCVLPNGIVAFNLIPKDQDDLLHVLLPLRQYFPNVWLSEIDGRSNIVLLATMDSGFDLDRELKRDNNDADYVGVDTIVLSKKFLRLPNRNIYNPERLSDKSDSGH